MEKVSTNEEKKLKRIIQKGLIIDNVIPLEGGCAITVRCCDGRINVGDTFDIVREYKYPKRSEMTQEEYLKSFEKPAPLIAEYPVSLTLKSIEAYGKHLDFICDGLTGYVVLEGDYGPLRFNRIIGFKAEPDYAIYET